MIERQPAAENAAGRKQSDPDIGVGDGRSRSAATVAGGPRRRAGALRADLQHARRVKPCDRAAASADRGNVDGRHDHGKIADLALGRVENIAVDDSDVDAGAAHVEADDSALAGDASDLQRAHGAGCGPGQQCLHRRVGGRSRGHDAAVGFRGQQRRGDADSRHAALQPLEITSQSSADIGVDDGDERALIFLLLRPDLAGRANIEVGKRCPQMREQRAFMGVVAIGMHQTDRKRFDALADQPPHPFGRCVQIDRPEHRAIDFQPLVDFADMLARHQWLDFLDVVIRRIGQAQPSDLQQVTEAARHEQPRRRAGALQKRVQAERRAMHEIADRSGIDVVLVGKLGDPVEHRLRRIAWNGRRLERERLPGRLIHERQIGEGAADIDAQPVAGVSVRHSHDARPPRSSLSDPRPVAARPTPRSRKETPISNAESAAIVGSWYWSR